MTAIDPLDPAVLPHGVRARFVEDVNGMRMHLLEAGERGRPALLLLHGFPELAYSWRKLMPALAEAGYHVIGPDQRGYGRTTGWDTSYDGDLGPFRPLNLVKDMLALLAALDIRAVAAVIGHDFGSPVASACALIRPDVFRAVALMSAPFAGPPPLRPAPAREDVHAALAALSPPRKHYQWYYSTRPANGDMLHCPQGLRAFLRAYYHYKSADWPGNQPFRLGGWTAAEFAKLPTYYVMNRDEDMAQTVAPHMPPAEQIAACAWLTEAELGVYSGEYERTGFQGGLQWYRCQTGGLSAADLSVFAGRSIDVPSCFIAGAADWGVYQSPGAFERMQGTACSDMRLCELVPGAGHWVQQEQPDSVVRLLRRFLRAIA